MCVGGGGGLILLWSYSKSRKDTLQNGFVSCLADG